nr:hypothetical protein [uncultured Flavobacterium sp.]
MIKKCSVLNTKVLSIVFGLIIVLIISFSFIENSKQKEITKTFLYYSFPVFKSNATYFLISDSIALIRYKNYLLYEFKDLQNFENDTATVKEEVRYRYFLFKKNEKHGFYYDSLNAKISKEVSTDSILSNRAFYGQSLFTSSKMKLLSYEKSKYSFSLIEKYKCKTKIDVTYPDTMIVYYTNKMKGLELTLSKELDFIKKMKVVKIRAIYNSQFINGNPNKFPNYEYKFELKEDKVSNLEKYRLFVEKEIKAKY